MKAFLFTAEQAEQYDAFVTAHDSGSFLQSWAWGEFQVSLGKTVVRVGVKQDERLVATAQFIATTVPKLSGNYWYCPYGPLLSSANKEVMQAMLAEIKQAEPSSKFVRLEPKQELGIIGVTTKRTQPGKTLITDLTQSEEALLQAMHTKTRYNIKVASKHEVTVSTETTHTESALKLLVQTASRQQYKSHSSDYYQKMIAFFAGQQSRLQLKLYTAWYKEQLASCAIMLDFGNTRTYLFGGSDDNYKQVMAPYAMHWQAMQDAQQAGLTNYDWWGIETSSGATPGFVEFKKRWGGTEIAYPNCVDIVEHKAWYNMYKLLRLLNRIF